MLLDFEITDSFIRFTDAKLFRVRRKESKDLLQIIQNEGAYERKYKLLEGAYEKLLNVRQTMSGYCSKLKR